MRGREPHRYQTEAWIVGRVHILILGVILLLLLFTSCGTTTGPSAYLWTDRDTLNTLTWNNQNGSLSGQYTSISYAQVNFPATTQPDVFSTSYSGTLSHETISLTIGSGPLSENVTGTQSSNGATLALAFINPSTGETRHQTWIAVTASQQAQLLSAFTAFQRVQGWLSVVSQDARQQSAWSDPNTFYLEQVRQSVNGQQAELVAIQQAQDKTSRCQLVARFQPIASSAFTLPVTAAQDRTLHDDTMLSQAWNTARRVAIPWIAGLALPWVIAASTYQRDTAKASILAARMNTAYRQDAATMRRLQQHDQQIAQRVTMLSKGCPPMPA